MYIADYVLIAPGDVCLFALQSSHRQSLLWVTVRTAFWQSKEEIQFVVSTTCVLNHRTIVEGNALFGCFTELKLHWALDRKFSSIEVGLLGLLEPRTSH